MENVQNIIAMNAAIVHGSCLQRYSGVSPSARRFSRYLRIVHARNVQRRSIAMQLLQERYEVAHSRAKSEKEGRMEWDRDVCRWAQRGGKLDWRTDAQHDREARCIAFANPRHGWQYNTPLCKQQQHPCRCCYCRRLATPSAWLST